MCNKILYSYIMDRVSPAGLAERQPELHAMECNFFTLDCSNKSFELEATILNG